jgi:hypothetical protein
LVQYALSESPVTCPHEPCPFSSVAIFSGTESTEPLGLSTQYSRKNCDGELNMIAQDHLLPGEQISHLVEPAIPESSCTDSEIEARYVSGEVRIVVEQARYPLKQIPDVVQSADYNLQPDFQRRPRWSREQQSRLIESLILNVPIPPVFLYEQEFGRYEVMDGRQRLTAINDYYSDKFPLEGLMEWPELNGRLYSRLPEQVRRGIDRRFLSAIVLLHETAKSQEQADRLKQLVFERINTGGENLSAQEKRNALYPGLMNKMCIRLARRESLCRLWNIPVPTDEELSNLAEWEPPGGLIENESYQRMDDVELVLRFFAHRQRHLLWRGGTRFDSYLTEYLKAANNFSPEVLSKLEDIFSRTADLAYDVLGEQAFWLWRKRSGSYVRVERPALTAYDPIMAAFSRLLDHSDSLFSRREEILSQMKDFYEKNDAHFDGRKTNPSDIRRRDALFYDFLKQYVS